MTVGFQSGSTGESGGSYGGLGGSSFQASSNPVYGDFMDPNDVGSGGGSVSVFPAGNGGGLVRIVAQSFQLDGSIIADGGVGSGGGGSGGGVRIDVGTLSGTGEIRANGGSSGAGGGGGRVAVYYETLVGFDFTQVTASGAVNGQDGTVFTQQQIFTALLLPGIEMPVMKAEAQWDGVVRLASLSDMPIGFKLDAGPVKMLDFKSLLARLQAQAEVIDRPQRRVFYYDSKLLAQNSELKTHLNLYLAMAAGTGDKDEDFDPFYFYDLNGNRILMIDPTGSTSYTYDELNRLTSITNNQNLKTSFAYDALGRRTSMTHDNAVVTSYTYDAASQLISLVHQLGTNPPINSFTYTYDKVGNRKTKADNNGTANYTYDTLNRLVQVTNPLPTNPLESFNYDEVGNRIDSNQNGLSSFNDANQLEQDGNSTYSYDNNGNLIQKTDASLQSTVYEYDAENKLIRVASLDKTVNYMYDGLGRRIEKEVTETAVTNVTQYIYDNEDILLELDGSNNITARYTHGPGIDEPLIVEKSGASFFYHVDGLGSITEITNSSGSLIQQYTYSSFGNIESQLDPAFVQPYTFTAREFDPETGLDFYRARTYDFSTGRFLQQDPLGFAGGDLNLYSYVANNPINLTDPEGLVAPVIPAIGACLANPSCAAALGAAAIATGFAARKLVETVGQPELPERFTCPRPDPGEFLRLCIGGCKSRFPDSFFRRTLCIATCIIAALSG